MFIKASKRIFFFLPNTRVSFGSYNGRMAWMDKRKKKSNVFTEYYLDTWTSWAERKHLVFFPNYGMNIEFCIQFARGKKNKILCEKEDLLKKNRILHKSRKSTEWWKGINMDPKTMVCCRVRLNRTAKKKWTKKKLKQA